MSSAEIPDSCPECGKPLKRNLGKYGPFLSCSGYPECKYGFNLSNHTKIKCPECGNILLVKKAKKSNFLFLGCSNYPKCNFIFNFRKNGVKCLECGNDLAIYNSRYGKFVGCTNYPKCTYKLNVGSPKLGNLLNLEISINQKFYPKKSRYLDTKDIIKSNYDLKDIQETLNLHQIDLQDVNNLCRIAVKKGFGTSIKNLSIASLYTLMKVKGIYIDLKKFTKVSGIEKKVLYKNYKKIRREILPGLNYQIKRFSINNYIEIFTKNLGISDMIKETSYKIINLAKYEGFSISGKDPKGIAAAAIYISSKAEKKNIPQDKLAEAAAITEVTLRSRAKELNEFLSLSLLREK